MVRFYFSILSKCPRLPQLELQVRDAVKVQLEFDLPGLMFVLLHGQMNWHGHGPVVVAFDVAPKGLHICLYLFGWLSVVGLPDCIIDAG
jgi:hypothetical protein